MACCVVGSMLMVIGAGIARFIKHRLLRQRAAAPEAWRLHADA